MPIQGLTEKDVAALNLASQTPGLTAQDKAAFQAITPASLTPSEPMNFETPKETPITTPVLPEAPAPAEIQPLQQEQDIFQQLKNLTADENTLGTEDAFKLKQEEAQKVQEKQGVVNSLKNQFDALTQEASGVDLQLQQQLEQAQQGARGQGITTAGLAPRLRDLQVQANQKKLDIAIKQHDIAAQHALASGYLATAVSLVDRAVKMEYGQKRDALNARRANIELLLKDPTLTLAQQKRAEELKRKYALEDKKIALDEKNAETTQGLILQAQQNGAPPALIAKARLDNTLFGVNGILAGWTSKETGAALQEYNFYKRDEESKGRTPLSFDEYQTRDANRKIALAKAGTSSGVTVGAPNSYKEWELAGGESGTGKTYGQWLTDSNVKAPTAAQQTVATYAVRIEQANPIITTLEKKISNMNIASFEAQSRLPSYLQSDDFQSYDQAARNFINSVLRRESGAVISPSEFDNAYKQYLPRAGDSATTLNQKRANRDLVFESLKKAAGGGYASVGNLLGGQSDQYATYRSQLQQGEILVSRNGRIVAITLPEFKSTDTKL